MKCKQKISGGFRSEKGAQIFARIRGFISTARKQGWNVFESIQRVISGQAPRSDRISHFVIKRQRRFILGKESLWICGRVLRTSQSPSGRVDKLMDNPSSCPQLAHTLWLLAHKSTGSTAIFFNFFNRILCLSFN